MRHKPKVHADSEPPEAADAAATEEIPAAEAVEDAENGDEEPELDPWEELELEAAKWKDAAIRTVAEMENLRKRTSREREEAVRYANQRLLEELLPVLDNFDMGMAAAAQDAKSPIYIGMDMVRRQLHEFLNAQGAREVPTDGLFDHNLHEAVAQEDCTAGEEGRILRVTRRGYQLRDRLLRPASVVVSRLPETGEEALPPEEEPPAP